MGLLAPFSTSRFSVSLTDKKCFRQRYTKLLVRKLDKVIRKFQSFKYNFSWFWDDLINFVNKTFQLLMLIHHLITISLVPDFLTRQLCTQCKILQSPVNTYKNRIKHLKKICTVGDFYKFDLNVLSRKQETTNRL